MGEKTHLIPGTTLLGTTRGGGSETVKWARNGPLNVTRTYSSYHAAPGIGVNTVGGYYIANPNGLTLTPGTATSELGVRSKGTTAMNATRPGNLNINLLTSAGELVLDQAPLPHDLSLWRQKSKVLKNISDSHLLIQFGWLPLLRDIQTFCRSVVNGDKAINDARRKATGSVHVRMNFPEVLTNVTTAASGFPAVRWDLSLATGTNLYVENTKRLSEKCWYEGTWESFFPGFPDGGAASKKASSLAGRFLAAAKPTPKMVWDLAPWSWAVDWLTGFGQALDAASNLVNDGLVLRNSFVMNHFKNECGISFRGAVTNSSARQVGAGTMYSLSETKTRFPSVPYFGFGAPGALSVRQVSILAALGVTRIP